VLKDIQLYAYSQKCDIIYKNVNGVIMITVSYIKTATYDNKKISLIRIL